MLRIAVLLLLLGIALPVAAQNTGTPTPNTETDINALGLALPEFFVRAAQFAESGNYEQAVLNYSTFILFNPRSAVAYAERGLSYMELQQYDAAIRDYHEALEIGLNQAEQTALVYLRLADAHIRQNDVQAALRDLDQSIEAQPTSGAYYLRGTIYQALNRQEDAQRDFDRALELDPAYTPALQGGLELASDAEDPQAIIDAASRLLASDPENVEAYFRRGVAYAQDGNMEASLEDFNKVIELSPDDPSAYFNRAIIQQSLGNYAPAVGDLTKVIELAPNNPGAYYLRGQIYVSQQNLEGARDDFSRVIQLAPTSRPEVYLYRGYVNNLLGDGQQAAADYLQWMTIIQTATFNEAALEAGETANIQMAEGRVFRIPFEGKAGQLVSLGASSATGNADPVLILLDPAGKPLIANDDVAGSYDAAIVDYRLATDGRYMIVVGHARGGSDGIVRVSLEIAER